MLRATLKDLWARKIRLLTTSAAVLLGVAFMAGTLVLTDTVSRTFDDVFADVNRGTDGYVRAKATVEGSFGGDQRPRVDDSLVATVAGVDGVALARGETLGYAQIVGRDGEALGSPGFGAPTFGGVWADDEINPFALAEGAAPVGDHEAVIDRKSAKDGDLAVGDRATILTPEPIEVTIVGIASFGTIDSPGGASFVGMADAAAQRWFGEPGTYDGVAVVAGGGVTQEELRDRIAAVLPDGHEAITGATLTEENKDGIEQGLSFFRSILLAFASIALFVGSFIIYNTFGIIVAQRTKELALLRALGASRRQVLRSVLLEATSIGIVASALGMAVGVAVAGALKTLLAAAGMDIPAGGVVVSTTTIVTAFVAGTSVAVTSAYFPARRAAKIPPLAAMRDVAVDQTNASKRRVVGGVALLLVGASALYLGLMTDVGTPLSMVAIGALLQFAGVVVLGPVLATPITRVLGAPLPRLKGMTGVLATQNATRNPRRTASTAAALIIGVALVGFITVFASSATKSINQVIDDRFTADAIVDSGSFGGGGFSPQLANDLRALDEIETVASMRFTPAVVNGNSTYVMALSETADDVFDLGVATGTYADLGTDGIAVNETYAEENDLVLGDPVVVQLTEGGPQQLTVRMTFTDEVLGGSYFVGLGLLDAFAPDQFDSSVFVVGRDDVSAAELVDGIEKVAASYPTANVKDIAGFKESRAAQFQTMVNLIYGLLGLAIVIALLGIANTLALSVHERTRELGLLRAVGMTRAQVRSTVRWESVLIALLGTALGLALGLFFGWIMSRALRSQGFTAFSVPIVRLLVISILAAVAGVVAAIWPARRASRLNVLEAIAFE